MLEQFGLIETNATAIGVGDRFERLTVIAVGQVPGTYRYKAICECECGCAPKAIRFDSLLSGVTTSCGCFHKKRITKHGLHNSLHYDRWKHMLDRCYNPHSAAYENYGGRGITVHKPWHEIGNFIVDLPDGFFEGAEIDRIDNNGNYEPGNIRWASRSQNADNRRSGRNLTFRGKTQSVRKWADEVGLSAKIIHHRIMQNGWDVERALTTPIIEAHERMKKARDARWSGHEKKLRTQAKVIRRVEFMGRHLTIQEIAQETGISAKLLRKRIFERNWPVEKAVADRKTPCM